MPRSEDPTIAAPTPTSNTAQLRDVQQSLTSARAEQITRVVAMVDALRDRSTADALIAPLRPRLMQLRPGRPLRFARLLFLPLDPLIVPPPRWRPSEPLVPRSALTPLSDAVRLSAGSVVGEVDALIKDRAQSDESVIAAAGERLWPEAARALMTSPPPHSWAESGLPPELFAPLARAVGGALQHAVPLRLLAAEARQGLPIRAETLDGILDGARVSGVDAWSMTLALLLGCLPDAARLLLRLDELATRPGAVARQRLDTVLSSALDVLEAPAVAGPLTVDLAEAGIAIRRAGALLDALDRPSTSPALRQRLASVRQAVDARGLAQFEQAVAERLLAPLQGTQPDLDPIDIRSIESMARDLRQLEQAGRRVGGSGPHYDRSLRHAAELLKGAPSRPELTAIDKIRIVEILLGPEAALAMLSGPPTLA